jgi:Lon-like ATP-dependent protease
MDLMGIFGLVNFFFAVVIGLYFYNLLKQQQGNKTAVDRESKKEMEKLHKLKAISLTEPLAERTRPASFSDLVGQEDGIKALRAALCGPNPQHVIIYGPPGVGKTAAARVVLEEAKRSPHSPFRPDAKFVEIDATTARFDDRGIADPLMGSVHDPIYQGAGPLGIAGIPQPKPGAVTKAHGGVLFIDEIGELHPIQMNKLLKVLEDRKVFLESAYYSLEDTNIPQYIHEIFQNGLPADFRLVGATTRMPHELPPAIRSRCLEIFFRALTPQEIKKIAKNAAEKVGFHISDDALAEVTKYANNGRDAVNMIQISGGIVLSENRNQIDKKDIEWVVNSGQYSPRPDVQIPDKPAIGSVNGLAVYGPNLGTLIEVEAVAIPSERGQGKIQITGIVDEEETGSGFGRTVRRKSLARSSIDNVMTVLRANLGLCPQDYDLHINFPGGAPIDGPSAGVSIITAIYSAITRIKVRNDIAMTGEVSIHGTVKPVGGVPAKIEAAQLAGVKKVLIPKDNWQDMFAEFKGIEIEPVVQIEDVIAAALLWEEGDAAVRVGTKQGELLSAAGVYPTQGAQKL